MVQLGCAASEKTTNTNAALRSCGIKCESPSRTFNSMAGAERLA